MDKKDILTFEMQRLGKEEKWII